MEVSASRQDGGVDAGAQAVAELRRGSAAHRGAPRGDDDGRRRGRGAWRRKTELVWGVRRTSGIISVDTQMKIAKVPGYGTKLPYDDPRPLFASR